MKIAISCLFFLDKMGVKSNPSIVYTVDAKQYEILSWVTYKGDLAFGVKNRKYLIFYNPNHPSDDVLKNEFNAYVFICGRLFILTFIVAYLFDFSWFSW